MTAHFRKSIRDQARLILLGLPTTGAKVWSGRVAPLRTDEMPGLVIVPGPETADYDAGGIVARVLQLVVIGECVGNEGLFDVLDTMAGEVEAALFGATHANLDGLAQYLDPPATQMTISERGENSAERIGTIRMVFPVHYRTRSTDPTTQA